MRESIREGRAPPVWLVVGSFVISMSAPKRSAGGFR